MNMFSGENLIHLIQTVSYFGIFGIVFAESGLFFGFFLPGDSLLFTAGLLASQGHLNILLLLIITFVAAVLGDNVGYAFGAKMGPKIFKKKDSLFFKKENITRAEKFYEQYGPSTIILARFIPIVRTFAPIVAGVGKMKYQTFLLYNLIGGFAWTVLLTMAGYSLSKIYPGIGENLELAVIIIVILSIMPAIYHVLKEKRAAR